MKLDNIYNAQWLFKVREEFQSMRHDAHERAKYAHHEDGDTKAIAEGVEAAIEEVLEKIERAIESL